FDESIREAQLIAKSEETQEILLQITVRADEVYQRQADTLIVWTEPSGKDYALSFQDVEGCTEVWEFITEVRRHLRAAPEVDPAAAFPDPAAAIQPRLPVPTLGNLAEIELQIRSVQRASPIRDRVVENVLSLDLVRKLVHLMGDAEDLQSVKDLHQICSLMQAILLLNDSNIYEHILRDDVFIDMVGLMEYDPEFPDLKAHYREFLQSNARHHQVIEFRDANIQAKVHQTYRLQYLKDVVLARVLDDPIFNVLNSLVIFNQIDIVQYIQSEEYFLRELFSLFVQHPGSAPLPPSVLSTITPTTTQPTTPSSSPFLGESTMAALSTGPQTVSTPSSVMPPLTPINPKPEPPPPLSSSAFPMMAAPLMTVADKRPAALLLLHQFCSMGKNVQLPMRLALFRTLVDRGILYPVQWALGQADIKVLNTAAEILAMVLDYDAGGVRGYILRQVEEDARREGAGGGPLAAATTNAAATTTGASGGAAAGDATASTPTPAGAASEATTVVATPPAAVGAPTSGNGSGSGNGGSHPSPPTLLAMMTSMLTSPKHELSLKSQLAESFRTLMDVPGLDSTLQGLKILQPQPRKEDQQSDRFLDYFYQRCAGELYKPMLDHVPEHSNVKSYPLELTRAQSDLYLYLCDLLSGFLLQHSYQSHFFVTTNNFAPRIASLLCAREKHLRL
ncbi:Platinum sensitivity protein, partial [Serendipita sp. 399]